MPAAESSLAKLLHLPLPLAFIARLTAATFFVPGERGVVSMSPLSFRVIGSEDDPAPEDDPASPTGSESGAAGSASGAKTAGSESGADKSPKLSVFITLSNRVSFPPSRLFRLCLSPPPRTADVSWNADASSNGGRSNEFKKPVGSVTALVLSLGWRRRYTKNPRVPKPMSTNTMASVAHNALLSFFFAAAAAASCAASRHEGVVHTYGGAGGGGGRRGG